MKVAAWVVALVALVVFAAAVGTSCAGGLAIPCVLAALCAYAYLFVTDHRENRR
jgi:hypothetical protein